jgi:hypothetical protein
MAGAKALQAAILRDASRRIQGDGLLLRMRSESLETTGFMESIHEQALDERSNIRKLFSRCSFAHVTFVHSGDVLFVLGFAEPAIVA